MKIGKFKVRLIKAALVIIDRFLISKINDTQIQTEMRTLIQPIGKTVDAIADEDPQDLDQIRAIWKQYVHHDLTGIAEARILAALEKLAQEKPELSFVIGGLVQPTLDTVKVLTDDNPENVKQLADLWGRWLTDEKTATLFFDTILPFVMESVTNKDNKED